MVTSLFWDALPKRYIEEGKRRTWGKTLRKANLGANSTNLKKKARIKAENLEGKKNQLRKIGKDKK